MAPESVHITISFDALVAAVESLSLADKKHVLDLLRNRSGKPRKTRGSAIRS